MKRCVVLFAVVLCVVCLRAALVQPPLPQEGPWNHDLYLLESPDGLRFGQARLFVERAGVPTVIRDAKGRLVAAFQWFPFERREAFDRVAVKFSNDDGKTWSDPQLIQVRGMPAGYQRPFDPTLAALDDGRIRIYFTSSPGAPSPNQQTQIYSAISSDGVHYTFEPGVRFSVEGDRAFDCSVVRLGKVWHYFSPMAGRDGSAFHAVSEDGLKFTRLPDIALPVRGSWIGNAVATKEGVRFYGSGVGGWSAFSRDGSTWQVDRDTQFRGGDPAVVQRRDGSFLMIVTGGPRADRVAATPLIEGDDAPPPVPPSETAMAASARFIYIVRNGVLYQYDAKTLELIRQTPLPADEAPPLGSGLPTAPNRMETFGQPMGGVRDPRPSRDPRPLRDPRPSGEIRVQRINSTYRVVKGGNSGFFRTGQNADIMLSGVDFDNTGGGLLFNHPSSIASDGTHLLLADTNNNRVLVWNKLPTANVPPDVVIGQTNMTRNTPGAGRNQLNWCIGVAASPDERVAVADTYNDRILLWNRVPAQNATPADVELKLPVITFQAGYGNSGWPWGVWTNGNMLMATCTHGSAVLVWKTFPTRDNQPPDLILRNPAFGTPRSITSDGKSLIVDDHNARVSRNGQGTFFYKTFPTDSEQPHDFFVDGMRMQGDFTRDGKLLLLSEVALYLFHSFPQSANAQPDVWLTGTSEKGGFRGGDGADVVVAGGRVYVVLGNENKILVYNSVPTRRDQLPDFAIGAPDVYTNTLRTNFFITNPVPASNGKSLFVSSDFDAKLYVWKNLPDESGAKPDLVYHLPDAPWDNALRGDTLALAGKQTVFVWTKLPLNGEMPDRVFRGGIGSVRFQELKGIAMDDKYFYLSDERAGMIYVWKGLPTQNDEPLFALNAGEAVGRLSSDGKYLAATSGFGPGGSVMIYRVADFDAQPVGSPALRRNYEPAAVLRGFNLPGGVLVAGGHLFVGDTCFGRVVIWSKTEDALNGQPPDVLLGKESFSDFSQQIGRNKLFWPCAMSFDGEYLWVGEFKFSGRILRFSPTPSARAQRSR